MPVLPGGRAQNNNMSEINNTQVLEDEKSEHDLP